MKCELEFASHPGNLCLVRDFVRQFLQPIELPDAEKDVIILGLDEACTNVIRYAYQHRCDQLMTLACEHGAGTITFRLRDFGQQATPEQLQGRPLELVRPGGLGLHLIRRAFTTVDYRLMPEGTELVLMRRLGENGAA
jgi:anti-sigma regulatory factor (Ser/Thr protein kinase)